MLENQYDNLSNDQETSLLLPIRKKDLGDFLYGLLGQQQSIERELEIQFDIDHNWIINLHELISQRIHQQANANLVGFKAIIYFSDGLKRVYESYDAFAAHSETKSHLPIGIKLLWNYLVQFPKKDFPEKQQISYSAHIHHSEAVKQKEVKSNNTSESLLFSSISQSTERSVIRYQIDHTERTWGDDIESIISNQVDLITRIQTSKDTVFNFARLLLALVIAFGVSLYYPVTEILNINDNADIAAIEYTSLVDNAPVTIDLINKKLDAIANTVIISKANRDSSFGYFILSMLSGIIMMFTFLHFTRSKIHSFLALSKEAEVYKEAMLKKENRSNIVLLLSYLASIIAGIIASYGHSWLTGA